MLGERPGRAGRSSTAGPGPGRGGLGTGGLGAGIHARVVGGLERVHMRAAARAALRLGEKVPPRAARRADGAKARRLANPDARRGAVAELENEEERRRVRQQHADLRQRRGGASAGGVVLEPVRNGRAIQGCRDCSPETQNAKEALSDKTARQSNGRRRRCVSAGSSAQRPSNA